MFLFPLFIRFSLMMTWKRWTTSIFMRVLLSKRSFVIHHSQRADFFQSPANWTLINKRLSNIYLCAFSINNKRDGNLPDVPHVNGNGSKDGKGWRVNKESNFHSLSFSFCICILNTPSRSQNTPHTWTILQILHNCCLSIGIMGCPCTRHSIKYSLFYFFMNFFVYIWIFFSIFFIIFIPFFM